MATIKVLPSGAFQIRVVSKLLPKPFYATFETREQAVAYSDQLRRLLAQGVVPQALTDDKREVRKAWLVVRCIAEYVRSQSLPQSDLKLLDTLRPLLEGLSTEHLNIAWAEAWVRDMKRIANLSPSTIRHRHGALARCLDWMCRSHPELLPQNPLRQLRRGFATYSAEDERTVRARGGEVKIDIERNRRLEPGELERILEHLKDRHEERTLMLLALESAMRLRECYTLSLEQVSLQKKTIHLDRTKNGDSRQVPMSSVAVELMRDFIAKNRNLISARSSRVFPFWNGNPSTKELDATTAELSTLFRNVFESAGLEDFRFHDLRHEATCRLYERTALSDILIARITGHRNLRMLQRYASLRGSDLATQLW